MCLFQYLLSDSVHSHRAGRAEKRKRLSSVRLMLLKRRDAVFARIEENYPVPGLCMDFATKEQTAKLIGLLTREGKRRKLEKKRYYSADTVVPFPAPFIDTAWALWRGAI